MEKEEWTPFRNALEKSDRKKFDEMWDIPKLYISACSNSVQYVRLHPTLMSILLFSLVGLAVHSGGVLQTLFAQNLGTGDDAEAELEEQEVDNEATTEDSSSDDNVLDNENNFGDDGTVVDHDNAAEEDAANVGLQDQDQTQDAISTNVDFDVQVGVQQQQPLPPT
jgi:hypothetical protein